MTTPAFDVAAPFAVVPIFVNAGTALAPLIIAPLTTVLAVLLRPRLLVDHCRRKPWLAPLILAIAVGLYFAIAALLAPAPAVASARGNDAAALTAANTNWTRTALELLQKEAEAKKLIGLRTLWSYAPDENAWVLSSPAVAAKANRVIGTAAVQDVGDFFGMIYCLDAATGRVVWSADKAGADDLKPFFSSPALTPDEKLVIVGQGLHVDADCSLLCFAADTGQLKWKVKTPLHVESSPAIRGDLVVVGAGAIEGPDHKPTSDPGYVFAVRISDGQQLWKHPVNDPESSPAIADDGTAYIGSGFNGNAVVALRTETDDELKAKNLKRELWRTGCPYPMTGPITLAGDLLLAGGGNSDFVFADPNPAGVVVALNRADGSVRWKADVGDAVLNRIVVRDNRAYCPVRSGHVAALDLATGRLLWKEPVSGSQPVLAGAALSADGQTVFAVAKDGTLALLRAADGQVVQSKDKDDKTVVERHALNAPTKPATKGLSLSSPTVTLTRLYVGSETGGLRAFEIIGAPKN